MYSSSRLLTPDLFGAPGVFAFRSRGRLTRSLNLSLSRTRSPILRRSLRGGRLAPAPTVFPRHRTTPSHLTIRPRVLSSWP
jgi:hypothetical protein